LCGPWSVGVAARGEQGDGEGGEGEANAHE
jgi:hypothetical protein